MANSERQDVKQLKSAQSKKTPSVSRRDFVHLSGGAVALHTMHARTALGAAANSAMTVGVIGCGGRGMHDSGNFRKFTDCKIVALADPFEDRLRSAKQRYQDDSPQTFQGYGAFEKLLASDVDTVVITSPPYFHPEHFEAVVDAGKHVYLEKPVSVDVAGANRVLQAGKKGDGKSTMMVGFQSRFHPALMEAVERVHKGAIGELVCGHSHYHSGWLSPRDLPGATAEQNRIRNWVFDIVLSGDILVEQNIHVLDVNNWVFGTHPEKAFGTGGRKIRTAVGDTWDHYGVAFWYPGDKEMLFSSTQFLDLGWGDAGERINGSKGALDALAGPAKIRGEHEWNYDGPQIDNEENKIKTFYQSVADKKYINEVAQGVESTLTAILGRTAAYQGKEVAWNDMMAGNEKFDAKLTF